jgi:hypothetical protein
MCNYCSMEPKEKDIITFINLCQKAYGVTFDKETAQLQLSKLLQLYRQVYLTPMPRSPENNHLLSKKPLKKQMQTSTDVWYNTDATREIIN